MARTPGRLSSAATTSGHLLELIRTGAATNRSELSRATGLSRPSVALRLTELIDSGLVIEGSGTVSSGGRPPSLLEFNADSGLLLTAALGMARSQAAVCDLNGEILVRTPGSPNMASGPDATVPWLLETWAEQLTSLGRDRAEVRGAGIGLPGTVEFHAGRADDRPLLGKWAGVPLAPLIAERFPVPVMVDNDVNVMALGEHLAGGHGHPGDMVFVKVSTGIGAGLISGGRLLRGALGAAGEIGHIPVRDGQGLPCRCGNTDCLEAVAGGPRLLELAAEEGRELDSIKELIALAAAGDPVAVTLVRDAGRRLGEALAGAVNLLNPEVVVLGGDLSEAYDHLVAGVREMVFQRCTALATRQLRVVASSLWDDAGVRGCAAMVAEEILSPEAVNKFLAG
ncbi:ROK family transcriptional regulator [Nocardiopsis lambiniae]|uniref:ROK family transcriptional regulator n=1 Tax=Nocardiopsis lambiniae TaxID=3075539 RepID=A0ABU2MD51_9ACTN|nr:ROK family transcriptional regulator [Nocardiopsis sp. DSM 44743]MDT0329856.1 ROK family transcriptional regulator [Nocardiopsis sp. DSM 44743]